MSKRLNIVVIGTDSQNRNQYIINALVTALRSHAEVEKVVTPNILNLVRACTNDHFDVLIAIGGAGGHAELLQRAIFFVNLSILWTTEDPYELSRNVQLSKLFDITFTNDEAATTYYPEGIRHLPFAGASDVHDCVPRPASESLFDLFFVGTAWPERVLSLNAFLAAIPRDARVKVGLSGNPHLPNFHLGDLDNFTDFRLPPREFARFANRSLVALTLDRSFSGNPNERLEGATPPPRVFELALAGTAQIYVTNRKGVDRYFVPGEELIVVSSVEEASVEFRSLIKDEPRRIKLAIAARQRALSEHRYENRAGVLLEAVRRWSSPPKRSAPTASRKRILCITHNITGIDPFGGVELYQQSLSDSLPHEFYFLYPNRQHSKLVLADGHGESVEVFEVSAMSSNAISDPTREMFLQRVLYEYDIDLVHFHHLMGHPLSYPSVVHATGIPSVYQMHDYYALCTEYNLIGHRGSYCEIRDDRTDICDVCLSTRGIAAPGSQDRRRLVLSEAFGKIDAFIHNIDFTKRKFSEIYPDADISKHRVVGLGAKSDVLTALDRINNDVRSERHPTRLQVAILGNFTKQKGGDLLIEMFWQLVHDPIDFFIIGRVDAPLAQVLTESNFENVNVVGAYSQASLPASLEGMQISIHFSIWPETYCIGLDEARASGLVPIVLALGALAERVEQEVDGILVDPAHPFDLMRILRGLCGDRRRLDVFVRPTNMKEKVHAHFKAVDEIYSSLFARLPTVKTPPLGRISNLFRMQDGAARFSSNDWKSEVVQLDFNPAFQAHRSTDTENQLSVSSPREVDIASMPVAPRLLPGDENLLLSLDEMTVSIATSLQVSLPARKKRLVVSVGVPQGLDRSAFELILVGKNGLRYVLGGYDDSDDFAAWASVVIDMSLLAPGLYGIVVGILIEGTVLRYGCGTSISIGGGDYSHSVQGVLYSRPWTSQVDNDPNASGATTNNRQSGNHLTQPLITAVSAIASALSFGGILFNIDTVNGFQSSSLSRIEIPLAQQSAIFVEGWVVPKQEITPFEMVIVRLTGKHFTVSSAAKMKLREDVARHHGNPGFVRSGFTWHRALNPLYSGKCRLELIGVDRSGKLHQAHAMNIVLS